MGNFFKLFIIFFIGTSVNFAENCPTVHDIKTRLFQGWKVLNMDTEQSLSNKEVSEFTARVENFLVAEWIKKPRQETVHCLYGDNAGAVIGAFLIKKNLHPLNPNKYWYKVTGSLQCVAGTTKCLLARINTDNNRV